MKDHTVHKSMHHISEDRQCYRQYSQQATHIGDRKRGGLPGPPYVGKNMPVHTGTLFIQPCTTGIYTRKCQRKQGLGVGKIFFSATLLTVGNQPDQVAVPTIALDED